MSEASACAGAAFCGGDLQPTVAADTTATVDLNGTTMTDGRSSAPGLSMLRLFLTLVVLGTIILAAIVGNIFVIAAIGVERNLRTVANYLIASLAVADLLVAALVMPLAAVKEVSARWFLGRELCDAWVTFDIICCTSSILHLVAISLDRYWAVTRVDYIHRRSPKRIVGMIVASWGVAVVVSIPPLFIQSDPNYDPNETGVCLISQVRIIITTIIWGGRSPHPQVMTVKELFCSKEFRCYCSASTLSCYMTACQPLTARTDRSVPNFVYLNF